jgi:hypothetical protein
MGQTTDPDNGDAVAFSLFMAVAVYGVRQLPNLHSMSYLAKLILLWSSGIPCLLWPASLSTYSKQSTGSNIAAVRV